VVVKPAPETPVDGLLPGEIAQSAGLPAGVLSVLPAGREVSEYLVSHPGVDKVAFTGSTAAGRRIASGCGQQLKQVSLELGGKSAAIVLDDADIGAAAASLLQSGLILNGQECTSKNRFIVTRARYDDTVDALADMVRNCTIGDPTDTATQIGPLAAARQRDIIESYIQSGLDQGARLVAGGPGAPDGCDQGWYVRPTLFADVDNSMKIAQEEIFGPVISTLGQANSKWSWRPSHQRTVVSAGRSAPRRTGE
jgi:aldehyde dehydrogenase (NAD+)